MEDNPRKQDHGIRILLSNEDLEVNYKFKRFGSVFQVVDEE